jgi:hypothetical protein
VAGTLLPHDGQDSAGDVEGAEHIRGELPLDVGDLVLLERTELAVAGVVDQNVDASEAGDRSRDGRERLLFVRDVQLDRRNAIGVSRENLLDLGAVTAGRDNLVAGGQGRIGDLRADTRARRL